MVKAPPKSYSPHWWSLALRDGKHCENKRRERYYHEYLEAAIEALESAGLLPESLQGPFRVLYSRGFRLGYDNAALFRARSMPAKRSGLLRRGKRAKLGR